MKRFSIIAGSILAILIVSWLLRREVLVRVGSHLIHEQPLDTVEVLFVLGGNSFDRGNEAARLYDEGYVSRIICMGGNVPSILQVLNKQYKEGELSAIQLQQNLLVDSMDVEVLDKGTSTFEEITEIARYCEDHQIERAMVLSSKFHTRRIRYVIDKVFATGNTELLVRGAPSTKYAESRWWQKEEGMIMVNNEYAKLVYYFYKY